MDLRFQSGDMPMEYPKQPSESIAHAALRGGHATCLLWQLRKFNYLGLMESNHSSLRLAAYLFFGDLQLKPMPRPKPKVDSDNNVSGLTFPRLPEVQKWPENGPLDSGLLTKE